MGRREGRCGTDEQHLTESIPEGFYGTKRGKILPDIGEERGKMRNLNQKNSICPKEARKDFTERREGKYFQT